MLQKVCDKHPNDWDRLLPSVLFAYREIPQDTTGFSPFHLLYGRSPRGPMTILKELYTNPDVEDEVKSVYQYVVDLQNRIYESCKLAAKNTESQSEIQASYADKNAKLRELKDKDKVLVLLPVTRNKLLMKWQGSFEIKQRISKTNYVVTISKTKSGKCTDKIFRINL